jgi:hypothetical protein
MRLLLLSLPSHFYIPPNKNATCNYYLVFYIAGSKCRVSLYCRDYAGFPLVFGIASTKLGFSHQEKKNMPTIFRLGARAIGTCLVLLAAAWQSIGKWGN